MRVRSPTVFKDTVLPPVFGPVITSKSKSSPRRISMGTAFFLSMRGWRACFRRMRPSSLKMGSVAFISMARDALAKMTSSCTMILRSARIESVCSAVCWLKVERITSISFCSSSSSSRMSLFSFTIAIGSINKVEPVED